MNAQLLILLSYLLLTLFIGLIFSKKSKKNKVEFFLAGRNLTKPLLFFTMAATNFSAFTIFGFSGAGYRIGYAFYPVMGFGTGFMALSFHIIGSKILVLSKKRNYITPSDFVYDRYNSLFLKRLFSAVMVIFTLPYIAIQAIASGKSINSLIGIPYYYGAVLVTVFIIAYVSMGGLRSIVWTDFIQGIMMVAFTLTAFIIIAHKSGGFVATHNKINMAIPSLFSRPGNNNAMGFGVWFGYMFLWFFADPMFPQLFQRFMMAKDEKSLKTTIVLYPIITTFLFFLTVSIGVMGRLTFPLLTPDKTDAIFPMLLGQYAGTFLSTLLLTGSIAALMSTMDSQLLTLTSMITTDFFKIKKNEILKEKLTLIGLGVLGLIIAIKPPQTILDFVSKTTFNGLSVLAPAVIGGLYWKKANKYGAVSSIIVGEGLVLAYYFKFISTPGIHSIVPIMIATGVVFVLASFFTTSRKENTGIVFQIKKTSLQWAPVFLTLFILGNDFWAWGRKPVIVAGLPIWIWYYFGLGILLSITFKLFFKYTETH
ncbi:MAG TPA: sodium:solute symporter family protein [Spirochaetes bacterium]|nr:sodium:solute symporter family protein [Spirochaetota bacterium]